MLPDDISEDNQFGFKKGSGVEFGCALLHDIAAISIDGKSPLFVCSLDAEKCFDSIWYEGLFFKLWNKIPTHHWFLLYNWYKKLNAVVRWNGLYSARIDVQRGTRQGSKLSPALFKIFFNDMLEMVTNAKRGIAISDAHFNSFAFADDVTLFSTKVTGLQSLIDICVKYSIDWRFNFNTLKSQCMIMGEHRFLEEPKWYMYGKTLNITDRFSILGVTFNHSCNASDHVEERIRKCRGAFYCHSENGLCYPGLSTNTKVYLWKTICSPILTYGCDTLKIGSTDMNRLEVLQGNLLKQVLGLSKKSRSSHLLMALGVSRIRDMILVKWCKLFNRIMHTESPCSRLYRILLAKYIRGGEYCKNTLLGQIIGAGQSPLITMTSGYRMNNQPTTPNGIVDSLRYLLNHPKFNIKLSQTHKMVESLVRAY